MNVFMGYNPLATKQAKVTVWVCEQDGETPVAPSNPSEGDCFVVYATDEAVLSNTPTSAKTYSNGEWVDAESGGGGDMVIPLITIGGTQEAPVFTCDVTYSEFVELINNSPCEYNGRKYYPCRTVVDDKPKMATSYFFIGDSILMSFPQFDLFYSSDGTITPHQQVRLRRTL